jgi:purine-binding chemotaxis protein CheW
MRTTNHLLVLTLDEQRYALPLSAVERVVRAVAVTPLPQAPEIVLGVVNVHGQLVPVVNLRKWFHLPQRDIELSDRFIIARTRRQPVIVIADAVTGVQESDTQDDVILIHDLETCFSLDEEQALQAALPST